VIQLAGEIALHQAMVERASREGTLETPAVRQVIDHTMKLTQDLQDASLGLRMIPIESLFQKIERVVRETSVKLKKPIRVARVGGDVTLDKIVIEGMRDPMIHLARNAVDHGIELASDRLAAGKKGEGLVTITAENTASGVTLIFADDGRGIDGERVFQKAVSLGLVNAEEALTPAQKLQLIFLPGLSTAEKVTDVSGRGVGMDVVADNVRRMGGRVEIDSTMGKGTRVLITLPTNLSIVDALVVRVNGQQYAVPNQDLSEVVDLREYNVQPVKGDFGQVIDFRGRIVPVATMNLFLNEPTPSIGESSLPKPGIIVHSREDWLAIAVDTVVGQQQIFVRPMHGHLSNIGFYSGSTILSDGEPTIILNLPAMVEDFYTLA
jgi:two-component system chemotaxis sensor kinase CheA